MPKIGYKRRVTLMKERRKERAAERKKQREKK